VAQKAGYKRVTYYSHTKKEDLSFAILNKYARAIGHDFSDEIPGIEPFIVQEEDHTYKKDPATLKEALKQRDHWKDKYYELMEKYQSLLEKSKND
jgi:hypothetical protein